MGTGFRLAPFYNFIVLSGVFYDDAMEKDGGEDSLLCSDEEYSLEAKINAWPSWSGRISRKNDTGGRPWAMIDIWPLSTRFSLSVHDRKNNFIVESPRRAFILRLCWTVTLANCEFRLFSTVMNK